VVVIIDWVGEASSLVLLCDEYSTQWLISVFAYHFAADDVKNSEGVSHGVGIPDTGHDCLAEGAFVDNPNCHLDYDRDCEDDDCLMGEIVKFTMILQDWMWGRRRERKLFFLMELTRFGWGLLRGLLESLFGDSFDTALNNFTGDEEREALMFLVRAGSVSRLRIADFSMLRIKTSHILCYRWRYFFTPFAHHAGPPAW